MINVGMIGVGHMGTPMAKNLLTSGYPVTVYDIDEKQMEHLAQAGARKAPNASELAAQSDVVLTVLTWPRVVEEVVLGKGGVLEGLREKSILIECSSIDHLTSMRVGEQVEAKGRRYVEAALIGRPADI
jgi:2-hydroxy-3-oxopropionate reductase